MKTLVTAPDLHTDDFEIQQGKVRVINQRAKYTGTWSRGFGSGTRSASTTAHRYCLIQDGWGQIHVDFMRLTRTASQLNQSRGGDIIMRLPAECPTPTDLIEVQLFDGGQVWIDAGSREVKVKNEHANTNTRYIVNLSGFFTGTTL